MQHDSNTLQLTSTMLPLRSTNTGQLPSSSRSVLQTTSSCSGVTSSVLLAGAGLRMAVAGGYVI